MDETAAPDSPQAASMTPLSVMLAGLMLVAGAIVFLSFAPVPHSLNVLRTLHVVAIVIWVGGDVTLTTLGIVFERRRDGSALAELGKMGGWIGTRIYTPALFAALGLGLALESKYYHNWGDFYIVFALVGWSIAATVGVGFVGPELGRIGKAAEQFGPNSAEVGRRVKRLFTIFRFDTALLILITLDMVAKPSF